MPAIERHLSRSGDIDDHAAALAGWQQRYTQLDAGPFRGELAVLDLPGVSLFVERTNVKLRQDVAPPPGSLVVGIPLPGSAPAWFHGQPVEPGDAIVLGDGLAEEFLCRERMDVAAVVLDRARVADALPDAPLPPVVRHSAAAGLGALVASLVGEFAAGVPALGAEAALAALPALIAGRCLGLVAGPGEPQATLSPGQRYRLIAEARDLIEAAGEAMPSVTLLARRTGVSVRTLEYCFAETLGLSPTAFIRNTRLNRARRDLKAAVPGTVTVADIAMKWGFWHLGRFSAVYRDLFGEAPSETLKRAPAR